MPPVIAIRIIITPPLKSTNPPLEIQARGGGSASQMAPPPHQGSPKLAGVPSSLLSPPPSPHPLPQRRPRSAQLLLPQRPPGAQGEGGAQLAAASLAPGRTTTPHPPRAQSLRFSGRAQSPVGHAGRFWCSKIPHRSAAARERGTKAAKEAGPCGPPRSRLPGLWAAALLQLGLVGPQCRRMLQTYHRVSGDHDGPRLTLHRPPASLVPTQGLLQLMGFPGNTKADSVVHYRLQPPI
ncbi:sterile alpha motif domain-containing protein 1-like [Loxodonta africana]|uniref:sterile alpha motif domain-containing protein 1-like n=1 Tax=Loxodonta africana TaxID=9785 RepID=UPI0030D45FE4